MAAKASNARTAARLMEEDGSLPEFSPKKRSAANGEKSAGRKEAAREAAVSLLEKPLQSMERLKNRISREYGISYLKNSEMLAFVPRTQPALRRALLKSPTRTLSGVSPLALMPPPFPCPGKCIYCPRGKNAPQSYTGFEPATMRAIECGYSARKQVEARLAQYAGQGHGTDKCHLIVMGGTFLCSPKKAQEGFMKEAFDTLNGKKAGGLAAAIDANERAPHRAIGVTFETRPDFGMRREADAMLAMGGTQVELGVQALSDAVYRRVLRGHSVSDVVRSTAVLRDSGFKICYHMMPGLFATPKQDVGYFRALFSDPRFQPDMVKIYPVLVMQGTPLYGMWKRGEFSPYTTEEAAEVIADATRFIPPYVRVPRIQRDIPSPLVAAGVKNSNLRQIVDELLRKRGEKCRCIRCREIGSEERKGIAASKLSLGLCRMDYAASGGKEIFLSFEDREKDLIAAFLRLRVPHKPHRAELASSSVVRELHVYGQEALIGERSAEKEQHRGLGARLLHEAEEITRREFGLEKISVLSGPGARGYYRKSGYALEGAYMQKKI
ncbi:MAG: tRNA uridine(34) 5-carboxymethylaminomethyl modification radical SAM/GNAT enzyme Elp3 [Candidatus Micrarchaeota archaeon]|nr:tRNA uridine(34) 5-carboxymethylaminomethyl modification radical SAM/GNAT enzyme Elp3 [Candidatus Micrarchaeota archaeon]